MKASLLFSSKFIQVHSFAEFRTAKSTDVVSTARTDRDVVALQLHRLACRCQFCCGIVAVRIVDGRFGNLANLADHRFFFYFALRMVAICLNLNVNLCIVIS